MAKNAWCVRSGFGNEIIARAEAEGFVALASANLANLSRFKSKQELFSEYQKCNPQESTGQVYLRGGQLWKFAHEIKDGDIVLSPKRETRELLVGVVSGSYKFESKRIPDYPHIRRVSWKRKIGRDSLKLALRNSVGSISTLFSLTRFLPDLESMLE